MQCRHVRKCHRNALPLTQFQCVADKKQILLISGDGNVIEPEHDAIAIGSGCNYAYSAALAYLDSSDLSAKEIAERSLKIASSICIYRNQNLTVETLE